MAEATQGPLTLVVVTHEEKLLEVGCDSVSLPASTGEVTILPGHTAMISLLGVGGLAYTSRDRPETLVIAGGFFEVFENRVTVLTPSAVSPGDIDTEEVLRELADGQAAMSSSSGEELAAARRKVQTAEARLSIASKSA